MAVSCVVFGEAVRRRCAATTKLLEQGTESMLFFLLPGFGSRVAGRMRHSWLRSASGPRRACAAARRLRRPTRRLRRPTCAACVVRPSGELLIPQNTKFVQTSERVHRDFRLHVFDRYRQFRLVGDSIYIYRGSGTPAS